VEGALGAALGNLFAVAENYPDLKASQNFMDLQKSLADIEDEIQLARRYYNGAARNLNILIQSFPSNLLASAFHFTPAEYFEIEDAGERAVPKVSFP
jgi:LemA protein